MLAVSDKFKAAIVAPSRKTTVNVRFEVLDNDAWLDNTKTATSQASISRLEQLTNRVRKTQGALASFEPDRWKLDGSFVIPPRPEEAVETEVGWWSSTFCDTDGYFAPAEGVTITCGTLYNAAGLTITFDPAANEYARDFTATIYGASDEIIHQEVVTDNTKASYRIERNLPLLFRVQLDITRWSTGQRRAKVLEIDFGLVEDYGEAELINMSIINELDPTGATLPAGELRFVLDNLDKRFNILNPTGLYYFLQERQRVMVEMGADIGGTFEMVPAGTYYLTEWKSDHGRLTASFTARDAIDLLAQGTYRKGRLEVVNAYDLIEEIILDAGINVLYTIDAALKDVYLLACVPLVSHREAAQLVALASRAVIRLSRQGRLLVERLAVTPPVGSIDFDNTYTTPSIKLDPLINCVRVDISSYRLKGNAEVYKGAVVADGESEVWVEYKAPCQNHQVTATGGTLVSAEHYAYASRLVVSGAGLVEITVTADEMEQSKTIYELRDDDRPIAEPAYSLEISNALINSQEVAADVAAWLLTESQRRLNYEIDWRQNPALECGDIVAVEDEFGANRAARITRQEFRYSGALRGRTGAKGGLG